MFIGLIVASLGTTVSVSPLLASAVTGAGFGMIVGMVLYSTQRATRPTFRSVQQIIAENYRVVVDENLQGKARRVMSEGTAE